MMFSQSTAITQLLSLTTALSFVLCIAFIPRRTEAVPLFTESIKPDIYCSSSLSEAIRIICQGRYNTYTKKFPESFGSGVAKRSLRRLVPDDGIYYRPTQNGPIHECCRNPCSITALRAYCDDSDD